jgi:hypothetical protein
VGEDPNPDFSSALDVTRHGDTGSLDLLGRDPTRRQGLESVLAERDLAPLGGLAAQVPLLDLSVLDSFRA